MLAEKRREMILQALAQEGHVQTAALAQTLQVAEETIRRDIMLLSRQGLLRKVHGGASAIPQLQKESPYEQRGKENTLAKRRIGEYAAGLIADGEIIAIDGGGAGEWMARSLKGLTGLTVATNSLRVGEIILDKLRDGEITGRLIMLGGETDPNNRIVVGALCAEMIGKFRFNRVFLGASALGSKGPMAWNLEEGAVETAFARQAQQTILLTESAKGRRSSLYQFMEYSDVQMLITDTDNSFNEELRDALQRACVKIRYVEAKNE